MNRSLFIFELLWADRQTWNMFANFFFLSNFTAYVVKNPAICRIINFLDLIGNQEELNLLNLFPIASERPLVKNFYAACMFPWSSWAGNLLLCLKKNLYGNCKKHSMKLNYTPVQLIAKLIPDTWKYNLFLIKSTSDFAKRKTERNIMWTSCKWFMLIGYEYDVSLSEKIFALGEKIVTEYNSFPFLVTVNVWLFFSYTLFIIY